MGPHYLLISRCHGKILLKFLLSIGLQFLNNRFLLIKNIPNYFNKRCHLLLQLEETIAEIPSIIDNRQTKFLDIFKAFCKYTIRLYIASGYFYVSGFNLVKNSLADIPKIQIVMGNETDIKTAEEMERGYAAKSRMVKVEIQKDLENVTESNIESLRELHDYIESGKIEVKIYVNEKFHAKAYIFERGGVSEGHAAIVGSSNFSISGMGIGNKINTELNSIHRNTSDITVLKKWFDQIWDESMPFQKDLLKIIESSRPYVRFVVGEKLYVTPIELFKTMVYEFLNQDITPLRSILAEFQQIGVINAEHKIKDFGGCIIADSVGLGKTFMGSRLIQDYQKDHNNVLLIIPSTLEENWRRELSRIDKNGERYFDIDLNEERLKIITITDLSRLNLSDGTHRQKLSDLKEKYSVIVIDEAHRFRNSGRFDAQTNTYSGNKNYANLEWLRTSNKKYILLTATPLNNSIRDLENLISIFTNTYALKNKDHTLELRNFEDYRKKSEKLIQVKKEGKTDIVTIDRLESERRQYLQGILKILEEVMILRTRTEINERYPDLAISGKKVNFRMAKIERALYEFPKTYLPIYENIRDFLTNLNLPHISLINELAGESLSGLYRILLFKRLESSIFSFVRSLELLKNKEDHLLEEISRYGWEETKLRRKKNAYDNTFTPEEGDIDLIDWIEEQSGKSESAEIQDEEHVTNMIKVDLNLIEKFVGTFIPKIRKEKYYYSDPKLDKLKDILSNIKGQKVIIFTQYIDTVDYLYNNLYQYAKKSNLVIDCITGDLVNQNIKYGTSLPRERKIALFSPIANNYKPANDEREIDILISTDTLSEGINLQDCSIIVNYDLPWNPMRIVQRIGRIDRIGNAKRTTVYNIFPDKELNILLSLIEKLNTKIINISTIIGKENYILSDDEEVNPRVIGEKIRELEQAKSFSTYESAGQNPVLKSVNKDEALGAKILEIKTTLARLGIIPSDFKEYGEGPVYSIVRDDFKKGIFAMFRIFDESREEMLEGKMENVILYLDFKTHDIRPIEILDLNLETYDEGLTKSNSIIKYDIEGSLRELEDYFSRQIYKEKRKGFERTKMVPKIRQSLLQRQIVSRLNDITLNRKLLQQTNDSIIRKATMLLTEFKNSILDDVNLINSLKTNYVNANYPTSTMTIRQNISKMEDSEFIRRTEHYYENYMKDNPKFSRPRSYKDIKYRMICWGAYV